MFAPLKARGGLLLRMPSCSIAEWSYRIVLNLNILFSGSLLGSLTNPTTLVEFTETLKLSELSNFSTLTLFSGLSSSVGLTSSKVICSRISLFLLIDYSFYSFFWWPKFKLPKFYSLNDIMLVLSLRRYCICFVKTFEIRYNTLK